MRRSSLSDKSVSRREILAGAGGLLLLLAGCSVKAGNADGFADGSSDIKTSGPKTVYDRMAPEPEEPEVTSLTIMMCGDILVHYGIWNSGIFSDGSRNYDHLFSQVKDVIEGTDLAIVNQETILGGDRWEFSGYPIFNSPQEIGDAEVAAGFDVAAHATNHSLDMGFDGICADLSFWQEKHPEMVVTGIADTEEASEQIALVERAGHKIAVLNFTESTNGIALPSSAPWCVRMLTEDQVSSDFDRARDEGAELIVVCPHWGEEYQASPNDYQRYWADYFLDQGADIIIGTHPHVLQQVELLTRSDGHRCVCYWSLGNYISSQARKDAVIGGLAQVTFSWEKVSPYAEEEFLGPTEARLIPVVTQEPGYGTSGTGVTSYKLQDYTQELAASNGVLAQSGCSDFTLQWALDFCAERLGSDFNPETRELLLSL